MKLVRFGPPGQERPGLWLDGPPPRIVDVRASVFDIADYDPDFFGGWGLERLRHLLNETRLAYVDPATVRLGPPISRPGKIVCLGKNYRDHAVEFDTQVPAAPIYFSKAPTAINGPFDPIRLPAQALRADPEVELALVIGRTARNVTAAQAEDFIAGYMVLNDVTDRDLQQARGQWFLAKSQDTFCPIGPFLVTRDEVPDPGRLRLSSKINGQLLQCALPQEMIFSIAFVLEDLTRGVTLEPGDILSMGTPAGIGSARTPPVLLKSGDWVETGITGLGEQRAQVTRGPEPTTPKGQPHG